MKRFTLLIVMMFSAALTFGQVLRTAADAPIGQQPMNDTQNWTSPLKGGGDIIWQTTFDWANPADERGWTPPDGWIIMDNSQLGNLWVWRGRNDTIKGLYTTVTAPSWFTTRDDGFVCLPMDEYNSRDGIGTDNASDSYIETPPIDCSAVSSVVVKFNQYFRYCCSNYNLEMQVTNDGGVHWATYDAKFAVAGNTFTPEKFRSPQINISDVAAGLPNVQVRFYMHGPSEYFWAIDDLTLCQAYQNDLVLEDYWLDIDNGYDATDGHINYWPKSQMGMDGATSGIVGQYYFRGALLNNGMADAENAHLNISVLKNGSEVYSDNTAGTTIWSLERDTQNIENPWLADDYGDYKIVYTGVMDNTEEVPNDNSGSWNFTVDDTLGHRADFSAESSQNTGGWVGGNNAGDMVGISYDIYAAAEINTITAYIAGFTASAMPQFQFVLMKDIDGTYEEWLTTDVIDMDSTYRNSWVTLPVSKDGETEFLEPGNYAVCVRMWGDDPNDPTNGSCGLSVGWDMTTKPAETLMYQAVGGNWYSTGKLAMVGFNLNESGAPTQAPVTFNVDMSKHIASGEFNPSTDFVDVTGSFNDFGSSEHFTDPDGDGIYTLTVDGLTVASKIEYKYRINGTIEELEGAPNRTYTVRYWNVINNVFNNGETAGVDKSSLVAEFNVYPNPTQGVINVDITNVAPSDLVITLTNIQGQVVYENKVSNVISHQEVIDNNLAKGLYFLSINNGKEVKVQKVVVQ
jgi:hypothetical protein